MSLFVGRPFFRKLCASKNDAEPYRRNILGPNFQKHPLFQFKAPIFLEALNLWVRCRRRLFLSRKMAPRFLEALSLWVRCRRRLFFSEKWPPDFQTPPPPPPAPAPAAAAPDEFSDPNLTPLPTHPGIKYVARTLAATRWLAASEPCLM